MYATKGNARCDPKKPATPDINTLAFGLFILNSFNYFEILLDSEFYFKFTFSPEEPPSQNRHHK